MKLLTILILSALPLFCQGIEGGSSSSGGGGNTTICNGSASATAATCPGVPAPTTYGLGTTASPYLSGTFIPGATSTGAPLTLNIAGLGAKNVFVGGAATSATNTVTSGIPYSFQYDGTQIQVLSGGGGAASTTVTISTSCPVTVGASTGDYYNNAAGACTYNLPTITAGMIGATVLCFRNYTGKSGVITLQAPASTFIDQLGVNGSSAGTLVSPASLGVAACLKIASTTQYMASPSTPAAWAGN